MRDYTISIVAALLVFAGALATTVCIVYLAAVRIEAFHVAQFQQDAHDIQQAILSRVTSYKAVLYGGRSLFASVPVTRQVFQSYTDSLDISSHFPELSGMGFTRYISSSEVSALTEQMRTEGVSSFTISPPGNRSEYAPIVYISSSPGQQNPIVGIDILANSTRSSALEQAKRTGDVVITDKVILKSDASAKKQYSFIMYLPIYKNGQLFGFLYTPSRTNELFASVITNKMPPLHVRLFDSKDANNLTETHQLYDSEIQTVRKGKYATTIPVLVGSHTWILRIDSTKAYDNNQPARLLLLWISLGGLLLDSFLFAFLYFLITSKKRALLLAQKMTQELREDKSRLEDAMTKDEFLSMAAHELRTPLGTMRWRLETMLAEKMSPHIRSYLEQNYQNVLRLIHLVSNLLDVSRIDQGKVKQTKDMIDAVTFVQTIIDNQKEWATKKGVHILFHTSSSTIPLVIDQNLLEEIVVNLITNAIKYNKPNGKVVVSIKQERKKFIFSVEDTGIGIPKKDQKTIFEKFKRGSNVDTNAYEGTGLGLFVVKSYVKKWHGHIHLKSKEGKGTIFTIDLPIEAGYNKN